ncbi:hypothetical protein HGRIS_003045 [Hohenbuehelia grisea]|uniref:Uncharacterized protein n=1 Tax=Hohenbuehelia grisea TaxID=104357 RepID=A0ABR3JMA3_9AGAR
MRARRTCFPLRLLSPTPSRRTRNDVAGVVAFEPMPLLFLRQLRNFVASRTTAAAVLQTPVPVRNREAQWGRNPHGVQNPVFGGLEATVWRARHILQCIWLYVRVEFLVCLYCVSIAVQYLYSSTITYTPPPSASPLSCHQLLELVFGVVAFLHFAIRYWRVCCLVSRFLGFCGVEAVRFRMLCVWCRAFTQCSDWNSPPPIAIITNHLYFIDLLICHVAMVFYVPSSYRNTPLPLAVTYCSLMLCFEALLFFFATPLLSYDIFLVCFAPSL